MFIMRQDEFLVNSVAFHEFLPAPGEEKQGCSDTVFWKINSLNWLILWLD